MPAENIIAIHDTVENSGRSLSLPSGMRPYFPAASQITKMTQPDATSAKIQPALLTTYPRPVFDDEARDDVPSSHQSTKPIDTAAVMPKTT